MQEPVNIEALSAAKQSKIAAKQQLLLDCFVATLLAMTERVHDYSIKLLIVAVPFSV